MARVVVSYAMVEQQPVGADRLFKIMMRLEFALKEIGFCRSANNQNAEVQVEWDRFANERLGASFFDAIKVSDGAGVLIESPPKRQVVSGTGDLSWEPTGAVSNVQDLMGALRRVRNNLFHGGKSGDPDRDRNDALVANALCVVDAILKQDADLRMIFEGNY